MNDDNLLWLMRWYYAHCDEDWEHIFGIHIYTLDNAEWSLTIDVEETELQDVEFQKIQINRATDDWLFCHVEHSKFERRCGPLKLLELLKIFRNWAETYESSRTRSAGAPRGCCLVPIVRPETGFTMGYT